MACLSVFDKARPLLTNYLWYEGGFVDDYLNYFDRQEVLKRFDAAINKSRDAWLQTCEKITMMKSYNLMATDFW